ncbi:MAG: hypothetical protein DMF76_15180 [Acidobacteria bacterium]|nr:MAG: hypothetical protein DMF76_15180 [Acidobacteriota bacterium]
MRNIAKPRSGEMFIARSHTHFVLFRIERNAEHFAQFERIEIQSASSYKHFVPTALFPRRSKEAIESEPNDTERLLESYAMQDVPAFSARALLI